MGNSKQVAVMDADARSLGFAANLSLKGYKVNLVDLDFERIRCIAEAGGIEIEGDLGKGFVPFNSVTSNFEEALCTSETIFCCSIANLQTQYAQEAAPFVKPGDIYLLTTGSAGSLEVIQIFKDAGIDPANQLLLGETNNMPQSARMTGQNTFRTRHPHHVRVAAFPAKNTDKLCMVLNSVMSLRPARNVLDTAINNVNFIIHPGPMLLNYAAIERESGNLSLMNEGMTEGVLCLMDALDQEKMRLSEALDLDPISLDSLYYEFGSSPDVYRKKGEPFGFRDRIHHRYITEDTPYGTVLLSSLGLLLGVPTPIADGINTILSIVEKTDFYSEGRTVDKIGLAGLTAEEISYYLYYGEYQ